MFTYRATVRSVHDGDSVRLDVDCGFHVWLHNVAFRLAGIDAPELGTDAGRAARDYLRGLLPIGAEVTIRTERDRGDKYGRWLAWVSLRPGEYVNDLMIGAGHAALYDGGPRA